MKTTFLFCFSILITLFGNSASHPALTQEDSAKKSTSKIMVMGLYCSPPYDSIEEALYGSRSGRGVLIGVDFRYVDYKDHRFAFWELGEREYDSRHSPSIFFSHADANLFFLDISRSSLTPASLEILNGYYDNIISRNETTNRLPKLLLGVGGDNMGDLTEVFRFIEKVNITDLILCSFIPALLRNTERIKDLILNAVQNGSENRVNKKGCMSHFFT